MTDDAVLLRKLRKRLAAPTAHLLSLGIIGLWLSLSLTFWIWLQSLLFHTVRKKFLVFADYRLILEKGVASLPNALAHPLATR